MQFSINEVLKCYRESVEQFVLCISAKANRSAAVVYFLLSSGSYPASSVFLTSSICAWSVSHKPAD